MMVEEKQERVENNYRNSKFDLCNINLLNKNFCVAQDALDTNGFGTPTEMFMSLMLHPSINKYKNSDDRFLCFSTDTVTGYDNWR